MNRVARMALFWIAGIAMLFAVLPAMAASPAITVYKSPTCGCCGQWIGHLIKDGFKVTVEDVQDTGPIKVRYGVPPALVSCHTALIGRYVIEGHVPPATIRRLLREHPKVAGLAVPGMPQSAPGMDAPTHEPYDVVSFDAAGHSRLYEHH